MRSLITSFWTKSVRLRRTLPIAGALLTSAALVLSAGNRAIAAVLRVNYSGTVTEEVDGLLPPFGFTFLTEEEIDEIFALKPPSEPTTIEGFYTFDENTNQVLFGQFQRITPTQKTTRSFPFSEDERAQYDEVDTFSIADRTSARYGESFFSSSEIGSSGVSVDSQNFSFSASESGFGSGNREVQIIGLIDQFGLENEQPTDGPGIPTNSQTPEPTSVPEPAPILALLLFAGVGLWASGKRENLHTSS